MDRETLIETIVSLAAEDLQKASICFGVDFDIPEDVEEYLYRNKFSFSELADSYSMLNGR
jgi:hypothetical protein